MSFFDSDIVRAEMAEISRLQEEVYSGVLQFYHMSNEKKLIHVKLLEQLIDKQKVLYMRLSLSDDPEALKMKENIRNSALMMGLPPEMDMTTFFNEMTRMLEFMKERIDKSEF